MRWDDFAQDVPRLGRLAHERLIDPGVLLVVTIRHNGTPRLSPVEPFILDGELWLSMMWHSHKVNDLLRDNRILLHSIVTGPDAAGGEVKVRGHAIAEEDPTRRARYAEAVTVLGWRPEEPYFHLFRIDLQDVTCLRYAPNGDQYVARWPAGEEFVRRATTATSVGQKESIRDLLAPE